MRKKILTRLILIILLVFFLVGALGIIRGYKPNKNEINYNELITMINNKENFKLLVYDNSYSKEEYQDNLEMFDNLYTINIDNFADKNYSTWLQSKTSLEIYELWNSSKYYGDFWDNFIKKYYGNSMGFYSHYDIYSKYNYNDFIAHIAPTNNYCKKDGLAVFNYIHFGYYGFDEVNKIYKIENGKAINNTYHYVGNNLYGSNSILD